MTLSKKAQERIAIAKDALAWEKAGALIVEEQTYIRPERGWDFSDGAPAEKQARDVEIGICQVCALGALLVAKAVRFNNVTYGDMRARGVNRLFQHFTRKQIDLIEAAFEGRSYPALRGISTYPYFDDRWYEAFQEPAARFRAIMNNIVRNNGTFVPWDIQP